MLKPCRWVSFVLLALGFPALASCAGVTSENEGQLGQYLENAAQYYDAGHYLRSIQQWDQALEIDENNDKARLGQAMAHYQLGRGESKEAVASLAEAERRLDALRKRDLDGQEWKAELGFALTNQRWCELYDRKIRKIEDDARRGVPADPTTLARSQREFATHLAAAEASFGKVLQGEEKESHDNLTCWLGLARLAAWRGDWDASLGWAHKYEEQVVRSKKLWQDAAVKFPRDAPVYESKLAGAQSQEAELRDLMGNVLFKLGRLEDAERELNAVIVLFPDRASAYLNRGMIRETLGDFDLARGDYKKFLELTDLPDNDATLLEAARRLNDMEAKVEAEDAAMPR